MKSESRTGAGPTSTRFNFKLELIFFKAQEIISVVSENVDKLIVVIFCYCTIYLEEHQFCFNLTL